MRFSQKSFFHLSEILNRLIFGAGFILYSDQTLYPILMLVIGYLLVIVAVGLSLTPPSKHKLFAVWSAHNFKKYFSTAGVLSFVFGLFIIYAALWSN